MRSTQLAILLVSILSAEAAAMGAPGAADIALDSSPAKDPPGESVAASATSAEDLEVFYPRLLLELWFSGAPSASRLLDARLAELPDDDARATLLFTLSRRMYHYSYPELHWGSGLFDEPHAEDVPPRYAASLTNASSRHAQALAAATQTLIFLDRLESLGEEVARKTGDPLIERRVAIFEQLRAINEWRLGQFEKALDRMRRLSKSLDRAGYESTLREAMEDAPPALQRRFHAQSWVIDSNIHSLECGVLVTSPFNVTLERADRLRAEGRIDQAIATMMTMTEGVTPLNWSDLNESMLLELLRERYSRARRIEAWRGAEHSLRLNEAGAYWTLFGVEQPLPNAIAEYVAQDRKVRPLSRAELLDLLRNTRFHQALMRD